MEEMKKSERNIKKWIVLAIVAVIGIVGYISYSIFKLPIDSPLTTTSAATTTITQTTASLVQTTGNTLLKETITAFPKEVKKTFDSKMRIAISLESDKPVGFVFTTVRNGRESGLCDTTHSMRTSLSCKLDINEGEGGEYTSKVITDASNPATNAVLTITELARL